MRPMECSRAVAGVSVSGFDTWTDPEPTDRARRRGGPDAKVRGLFDTS